VPSKNVGTLEAFYDLVNRRAVDKALDLVDPNLVADFSRANNPDINGVYHGRDEVRDLLTRFLDAWEEAEFFADEYVELGEYLVRIGGVRGRGRGSGIEVTAHGSQVWRFRDGRVVSMEIFQSKAEALEHIGQQ
jgi:ketosteroid isomerase-like protein